MDSLNSILLRRLPPKDIDTIEQVFKKAVTFMKQIDPHGGGNFVSFFTLNNVVAIPPFLAGMSTTPNQMPMLNPIPLVQQVTIAPMPISGYCCSNANI